MKNCLLSYGKREFVLLFIICVCVGGGGDNCQVAAAVIILSDIT